MYGGTLNVCISRSCSAVGVSSGSYPSPDAVSWFVFVSTPANEIRSLAYVDPWNVNVGVLGKTSDADDVESPRPENVPNRESATTSGHRSAAQ